MSCHAQNPLHPNRLRLVCILHMQSQNPLKPTKAMKPILPHNHHQLRRFVTKYTAKITSSTTDGRILSAKVRSHSLPADSRGFPIPRRELICKITQILKTPKSSSNPFFELENFIQSSTLTLTITPDEVSLILKTIQYSPHLCLKFFQFCPIAFPNYRHDTFSFNRLILILANAATFGGPDWAEKVRDLVVEMEKQGVRGNVSTVNILIGVFGAPKIDWCLELANKWGLKLNSYSYRCILQAYLRSYEVDEAFNVYEMIKKKGFKLDAIACNMLLHALANNNKVDQAYMVFEDMKKKYCEPDEYTYTIMVRMTGKIGKPEESMTLFLEMLGKGFVPSLIVYNTIIEALSKNRMAEKAIFLFTNMVENNCRPNEFTYRMILNVLITEGQLGKLDKIVELSKRYMTRSIYAYLVRTLSKLGHASEAHRLFCSLWTFDDMGDRDACMSMLESFCNRGKMVEAIDLLDKMHEKGIHRDIMMYNAVLSGLGRSKQISHLHDLYEKMKRDGPEPDIYSYNILIASFGRAGKVDEAIKVFEQLEESDFQPDIVSYNSLINCLGKNGNIDEAHMRFREMLEKGLNPDVVTYSTLIECFGKTDKVEMASRLFDDMVSQGCSPNIVTYNILLDCFERTGKTAEAVDLYARLKQQGLTPDSITYVILERLQSGSHRRARIRKQNPVTGWIVSPLR